MNVLRTRREKVLLGSTVVLLAVVGLSEAYKVVFAAPRQVLAREESALERELNRLTLVHARSEEIRARYAALPQADRDRKETPASPGELLARLEELAQDRVTLVEVQPDEKASAAGTALSLEFEGVRGPVGDFVERMIRELQGQVHALDASVDAQGTVRCQAKVVFGGAA